MFIEVTCLGSGTVALASAGNLIAYTIEPCVGQVTTATIPGQTSDLPKFVGKMIVLRITASAAVSWAIYIAGSVGGI
jgi:hypothetical protein